MFSYSYQKLLELENWGKQKLIEYSFEKIRCISFILKIVRKFSPLILSGAPRSCFCWHYAEIAPFEIINDLRKATSNHIFLVLVLLDLWAACLTQLLTLSLKALSSRPLCLFMECSSQPWHLANSYRQKYYLPREEFPDAFPPGPSVLCTGWLPILHLLKFQEQNL